MVNDNWLYKNIHTLMAANDAISGSVSIYIACINKIHSSYFHLVVI